MKRIALVLVALGLAVSGEPAQAERGFDLGAWLTVNRSTLVGDEPDGGDYKKRNGPGFGVHGDFYLNPEVALSLQPMYVERGTEIEFDKDYDGNVIAPPIDVEFRYIDLPLLLKVRGTGKVRPYVNGGLSIGFLLDAELERQGETSDATNDFKDVEISYLFGVGISFPIGSPYLSFEARYIQGTSNISNRDDNPQDSVGGSSFRASGTMLLAGITLPLMR